LAQGTAPATPQTVNAQQQAAFLAALQGLNQELSKAPDRIVADIGGQPVTAGEVANALLSLPPIYGGHDLDRIFADTVHGLLAQKALEIRAREKGIDKQPLIRQRIAADAMAILSNEYLRQTVGPTITDDEVRKAYDQDVARQPGAEEAQIRVIMTPSRDRADQITQRLTEGADFAALAVQFSRDPTAPAGGEVGFVGRGAVLPALAAVIFALAPGQATTFPVQANGAYYFIKVEARRQLPPPSLDSVRGQVVGQLIRLQSPTVIQDALKGLVVHQYGMVGKPAAK
jgi:peptidyl-prolyl cis-trans isomerase C